MLGPDADRHCHVQELSEPEQRYLQQKAQLAAAQKAWRSSVRPVKALCAGLLLAATQCMQQSESPTASAV